MKSPKPIRFPFLQAALIAMLAFTWSPLIPPSKAQDRSAVAAHRLPDNVERLLGLADELSEEYVGQMEKGWQEFFTKCQSRERLKPYVGKLISYRGKFELAKDAFGNQSSRQRIATLMRNDVFNDEVFIQDISTLFDLHSKFLAEQNSQIAVLLKVDVEIPAKAVTPSRWDLGDFRRELSSAVDLSANAAKADVGRLAATTALGEVLSQGAQDLGRGTGVLPQKQNSAESFVLGLALSFAIDAVLDKATDPTDQIVAQLSAKIRSAELAALAGTHLKLGVFPLLRQANAEQSAARRAVLMKHFGK